MNEKHPRYILKSFFGVWPFFAKKGQNLGELFIKSSPNPAKIFNNFSFLVQPPSRNRHFPARDGRHPRA